jgi:2-(1,2-epoxy-1,2-dihydrophenyl)acetyl-CoA isomerase
MTARPTTLPEPARVRRKAMLVDVIVSHEADGRVTCLTMNRSDSFNSCTRGMLSHLHTELLDAFRDPEVQGVVITGAGRAFSAGQDLDELVHELDLPHGGNDTRLRECYGPLALLLGDSVKPVVAAVNGVAAGAGLALAALCATRVAASTASFVPSFIDLGLVPDTGATHTLPRLIGADRAMRWLTDGRKVGAAEALTWGLVDRVTEPDQLLTTAVVTAQRLGTRDARAVALTKELIRFGGRSDLESSLMAETNEQIAASEQDTFRRAVERMSH